MSSQVVIIPPRTLDDADKERRFDVNVPSEYDQLNLTISYINGELRSINKHGADLPLLPDGAEDHTINFERTDREGITYFIYRKVL